LNETRARRPLEGLTVVITGSRRASEQAALVSSLGGTPYVVPTVGISLPPADSEVEPFLRKVASAEGADYVVFMTATGVRALLLAAERLGVRDSVCAALNRTRTVVVARSGKPKGELSRHGIKVDATPPREEATASGIAKLLLKRGVEGKSIAILWHGSADEATARELLAAGAREVTGCMAYHYSRELAEEGAEVLGSMGFKYESPEQAEVLNLVREISGGGRRIDAITFTSPPAAGNLVEIAAEHGLEKGLIEGIRRGGIVVAAVGSSTREELEGYGIDVQVVPEVAAMGAMMNALGAYMSRRG